MYMGTNRESQVHDLLRSRSASGRKRIWGLLITLMILLLCLGIAQAARPVPYLVRDIRTGGWASNPGSLLAVGGTLFFEANDGTHGRELWRSDGTKPGTMLVKDINPDGAHSYPYGLAWVNGKLFFRAQDGTHGRELWSSDGTGPGTAMVRDINPEGESSYPGDLTAVGGSLFFSADDGTFGRELWESDGTALGPALVEDRNSGGSSNPGHLIEKDGWIFFSADDGIRGPELWRSDGSPVQTRLVKDINPDGEGSHPEQFTLVNGTLFFSADNGAVNHGRELWSSDGTGVGTGMVDDINSGSGSSNPDSLVEANGILFFSADDGAAGHGRELWRSDGTPGGTFMLRDINQGSGSSNPEYLTEVDGLVFFTATDGASNHGFELWKSDGTPGGTVLVYDVRPGIDGSYPEGLTDVYGTAYFSADDGTSKHGRELWKSDGTATTTSLVHDIYSGGGSSSPESLEAVGGTLFFRAGDGTHGTELWALLAAEPDLYLTKTAAPTTPVHPGGPLTYTLTFGNIGKLPAAAVAVQDILPDELTEVRVDSNRTIIPIGDVPYTWHVGDLGPAETGLITITGSVLPSQSSGYTFGNTASITATTVEADPSDNEDSASVTIDFPPVAEDDDYGIVEDSGLIEMAPGVLGNDHDAEGQDLTAILETPPPEGELIFEPDGSFNYTPTPNLNGELVFTYRAHDGIAASDLATVTIDIEPRNDLPVAVPDSYLFTVSEVLTVTVPGVLANDQDVDGDDLTAVLDTPPVTGTLAFQLDGSFSYTPTVGLLDVVTFTYHADDGIVASNTVSVTLNPVQSYPTIYLPLVVRYE